MNDKWNTPCNACEIYIDMEEFDKVFLKYVINETAKSSLRTSKTQKLSKRQTERSFKEYQS